MCYFIQKLFIVNSIAHLFVFNIFPQLRNKQFTKLNICKKKSTNVKYTH